MTEHELTQQQESTQEQNPEVQAETPVEEPNQQTNKENNFARLRQKSEQLQKERDEAIAYAQELAKKYAKPQDQQEEYYHINPDDLVEGKHLSKYDRELAKLKEQLKNYEQQTQEMVLEAKLKSQYHDFDSIVNKDNIDQLREIDPDITEAIAAMPDLHKKAVLAYKMIKKYNIGEPDSYEKDRIQAQKNALKPKPLASISPQQGETPLSRANAFAEGLTDDLKKKLWQEMREASKNT